MAKPKQSDEIRIKVIVMLKLLEANSINESQLHKDIADLLNRYENKQVTSGQVAAIHTQSNQGHNTPYEKYDWELSLSKFAFKGIIERNKPVQDKLLDLATRSEINIRNQKQYKQDETPEMNNYQQSLESQKNLDKSNQRFVKELNSMDIYSRLRVRGINRLGKLQVKEIKRISYEEIHFIMDNKVLKLRKGDKDVTQRF